MDVDKRLRYFNGQFLEEEDFNDQQAYHVDRQRRHNRQLHTPGIAEGLTVSAPVGLGDVTVNPGTALDAEGRQVVLSAVRTLSVADHVGETVLVRIYYLEEASDPASEESGSETRWHENPIVELVDEAAPPSPPADTTPVLLARITVDGAGVIASEPDLSVRVPVGSQPGDDVSVSQLRLRVEGAGSSQWPTLSAGAANRLDVDGDVAVSGDLRVGVHDVGAHVARTDNPHGVTAAQVGAPVSLDGVSNPGGNIDLASSGGITVTPNNAGNSITIGETHSSQTNNPHNVTAAQVGAPVSLDGVSNPGGNIDLVGSEGITVTPNDATNSITIGATAVKVEALVSLNRVSNPGGNIDLVGRGGITVSPDVEAQNIIISESHSSRSDNPHRVTAAQVGAPVSLSGVRNAGGNINLVGSGGITVRPDDEARSITISESHSSRSDNPHRVTAAQIGALTAEGGDVQSPFTVVSGDARIARFGDPGSNSAQNAFGRTSDKNVVVFISGQTNPNVGTSIQKALLIWPLTTGMIGLEILASTGGVDSLQVGGTARFSGTKIGYVGDTFVNRSGQVLHPGDVVKLTRTGVLHFQGDDNRIPIAEVTLADQPDDSMVIGVVDREATVAPDEPDTREEPEDPTSIPDGGEVFVVTLGSFAHCRVDADVAPIAVGDLLTSSKRPGHAMKAVNPKIGSILGKALEPLAAGQGYISIFVNTQ